MSSSFKERVSTSNVVVGGQTGANGEGFANQESSSRQAVSSNIEGKGFSSTGLPPLSINTGRMTEGFGIRSRSWNQEVGFQFLILFVLAAVTVAIALVSKACSNWVWQQLICAGTHKLMNLSRRFKDQKQGSRFRQRGGWRRCGLESSHRKYAS